MNYIGIDVHKSICTAVVMNDDEKVIDQIIAACHQHDLGHSLLP